MPRQVDLGQIVPNIKIGTTTTGLPSTNASVVNVGTDLNPILNFTIPRGDPGAINLLIVNELPLVGSEDTLYFVPKTDTEESDMYDEYVWINNDWELVGTKQITVDLSDYYTKTQINNLLNGKIDGVQINGTSIVSNNVANILTEGVYGTRNKLLTKGYANAHYVLEETIDDNVGYMYISPNIKDDKDVDFSINAQSNLDSEASATMNFGVEYDEDEGKGHGYFRLELYDAGSIEIDNNGTKITKVITPTNDDDAVNKAYVDNLVGDIESILTTLDTGSGV